MDVLEQQKKSGIGTESKVGEMSYQTIRALFLKVNEGRFSIIWTLFVKLGMVPPANFFLLW